jgi:hypothetical protein
LKVLAKTQQQLLSCSKFLLKIQSESSPLISVRLVQWKTLTKTQNFNKLRNFQDNQKRNKPISSLKLNQTSPNVLRIELNPLTAKTISHESHLSLSLPFQEQ